VREFDHLVIAARTLEEGAAWVEARLGVPMAVGGKHEVMGTHNRLLSLGPGRFLEVISIDPEAPPPARARWFELDTPEMKRRVAKEPALVHWVERTDDLEAELAAYPERVEILCLQRGPYRWRMGVPRDGRFPATGKVATLIQWEGGLHPADRLPVSGCEMVHFTPGERPSATFRTPGGTRTI
jgi:hypothetical protein